MENENLNEAENTALNKGDVSGMFSFAIVKAAFEAGYYRGAQEHGSTAGWLGCKLDSLDWDEWAKENLR